MNKNNCTHLLKKVLGVLMFFLMIALLLRVYPKQPVYASPEKNVMSIDEDLVAYYPFEGNANDHSGFANHGTVQNAVFTVGKYGQGIEFTGEESSYVEVPHSTSLETPNAVTISAWANVFSNRTGYSSLIYKAGEAPTTSGFRDRVFSLWARRGGGVHFTSTPDGETRQKSCNADNGSYTHNAFVHFVGVVDPISHTMSIYINGSKVSECPYMGDQIRGGEHPLRLGGYFNTLGDQSGLTGILDEVRIYNRTLSPEEIEFLYRYSPQPEGNANGNLIVNGRFDAPDTNTCWTGYSASPPGFGWTILPDGSRRVEVIDSCWEGIGGTDNPDGVDQSVDIDGGSIISQTISTIPGTSYEVSLFYSRNPRVTRRARTGYVTVTGNDIHISVTLVHTIPNSTTNMNWQQFSQIFIADSTETTLAIQGDRANGLEGFAVDNVRVTAYNNIFVQKRPQNYESEQGDENSYTLRITNATTQAATIETITDTLPISFTYIAGTTAGLTSADPRVSTHPETNQQILSWAGGYALAARQGVSLTFAVQVAADTPTGSYFNSASLSATRDGNPITTIPAIDVAPVYVPPPTVAIDTIIEADNGSVSTNPYSEEIELAMPIGNRSDIAITTTAQCPDTTVNPSQVELHLNDLIYSMTENPAMSNRYSASIPASNISTGSVTIHVTCPGVPEPIINIIVVVRLYDPSGVIRDATTNLPIPGATVTLYRLPSALPDTPVEQRDCRTIFTRNDGSQEPWGGEPDHTPNSSDEWIDPRFEPAFIDPPQNPQITNVNGRYGWNVIEGCWYIVVTAEGYITRVSPVVGVPPDVTDLDLTLVQERLFLPLIMRHATNP